MSEYAGSKSAPQKFEDMDLTGTLFDESAYFDDEYDKALDDFVDKTGQSDDDARRELGDAPTEIISNSETKDGPAVQLEERVLALDAIMKYHNHAARALAMQSPAAQENLRKQYKDNADYVREGAEAKLSGGELYYNFSSALDVLSATDQPRSEEYSEYNAEYQRKNIQKGLRDRYGANSGAYAKDRHRAVKQAEKTVKAVKKAQEK